MGRKAKDNLLGFSESAGNYFVTSVKRALGTDRTFNIFGTKYGPSEVAAEIFGHLKREARSQHRIEVNEAIVTIPVNFGGRARRELRHAADMAGIYIKTFVHEPFAAIVGYCYTKEPYRSLEQREGESILVFDWGGGTLDVTVGRIEHGSIVELGAAGLVDRSGDHFDAKLSGFVKTEFSGRHRIPGDRMVLLPSTKDRLRAECERCKIALSGSEEHSVQLADFLRHGQDILDLNEPVTRRVFEDLIREDTVDAWALVDRVLEQAGLSDSDIDLALLIGGTSRIPMVRKEMQDRFGTKMVQVKNADTIIAEGAAIVDSLGIHPVLARPICIELSNGEHYEIFGTGDVAKPEVCRKEVALFCTDNRDGQARLVIKEGQGRRADRFVTKKVLSIPVCPKLPKPYNHERVIARFALDADLVLKVSASGAVHPEGAQTELFDLCFALKTFGDDDGI